MSVLELCDKIHTIQTDRMKWERKLEYIQYMNPAERDSYTETTQRLESMIRGAKEEEFRLLWMIQMNPMTIHEIVGTITQQSNEIKKIGERVDELEKK